MAGIANLLCSIVLNMSVPSCELHNKYYPMLLVNTRYQNINQTNLIGYDDAKPDRSINISLTKLHPCILCFRIAVRGTVSMQTHIECHLHFILIVAANPATPYHMENDGFSFVCATILGDDSGFNYICIVDIFSKYIIVNYPNKRLQ